MLNWRLLSIVAVMPASFAVSILVMGSRSSGGAAAAPESPAVAASVAVPATRYSAAAYAVAPPASSSSPPPAHPAQNTPPSAPNAQAIQAPVTMSFRSVNGGTRYVGQVHNQSDQQTSVTLNAASFNNGHNSRLEFDLGAGETRSFTSDPSFEIHSGDEVLLQTSQFGERIERVP